jgi:hypothetical protein
MRNTRQREKWAHIQKRVQLKENSAKAIRKEEQRKPQGGEGGEGGEMDDR